MENRLLALSVPVSFGLTLVSSLLYAVNGWTDPLGALLHILGGALGGLAVVRLAGWVDRPDWLPALVLLLGMLGVAGVVGYGFNTIEVGLGGVDLIDATGVAVVLKPLGLCWPVALLLVGIGLVRNARALGAAVVVGALLYPVARIANIGWLGVVADLVLLAGLVAVPFALRARAGTLEPAR